MPTISENKDAFATPRGWVDRGENWSAAWGGSHPQWYSTVLPRIAPYLPCGHLLEIAPGFGRFTRFLLPLCDQYTGIDLSEMAVQGCRERFSSAPHARFEVCDGLSLPDVGDGTIEFAFSFDSMVHVEQDVIESYAGELARVLRPGAYAVLHHSNMADVMAREKGNRVENPHWRASSVGATSAADAFRRAGLAVVAQELVSWGHQHATDTISLLWKSKTGSAASIETRMLENSMISAEMSIARQRGDLFRPIDATLSAM